MKNRINPSHDIIWSAAPAALAALPPARTISSILAPILGSATATDSMPTPPMIDISSAPPRGNRSDVTPSIVGQKYVLPTANVVAAASATTALAPGRSDPSQ